MSRTKYHVRTEALLYDGSKVLSVVDSFGRKADAYNLYRKLKRKYKDSYFEIQRCRYVADISILESTDE